MVPQILGRKPIFFYLQSFSLATDVTINCQIGGSSLIQWGFIGLAKFGKHGGNKALDEYSY